MLSHVPPQQTEGKLDELLRQVAETSPGPDTPSDEFNDANSTDGMIIIILLYRGMHACKDDMA